MPKSKTIDFVGNSRRRPHVRDTIPLERAQALSGGYKNHDIYWETETARHKKGDMRRERPVRRSHTDNDFRTRISFQELERDDDYCRVNDARFGRGRNADGEHNVHFSSDMERNIKWKAEHSDRPHNTHRPGLPRTPYNAHAEELPRHGGDNHRRETRNSGRSNPNHSSRESQGRNKDRHVCIEESHKDSLPSHRRNVVPTNHQHHRQEYHGRYHDNRHIPRVTQSLSNLPHSNEIIEECRKTSSTYQRLKGCIGKLNGYHDKYHEKPGVQARRVGHHDRHEGHRRKPVEQEAPQLHKEIAKDRHRYRREADYREFEKVEPIEKHVQIIGRDHDPKRHNQYQEYEVDAGHRTEIPNSEQIYGAELEKQNMRQPHHNQNLNERDDVNGNSMQVALGRRTDYIEGHERPRDTVSNLPHEDVIYTEHRSRPLHVKYPEEGSAQITMRDEMLYVRQAIDPPPSSNDSPRYIINDNRHHNTQQELHRQNERNNNYNNPYYRDEQLRAHGVAYAERASQQDYVAQEVSEGQWSEPPRRGEVAPGRYFDPVSKYC